MRQNIISYGKFYLLDDKRFEAPCPSGKGKMLRIEWKEITLDQDELKSFVDEQRREPMCLQWPLWFYKDHVLKVDGMFADREDVILKIKHYVLRSERDYERIKQEVETLENMGSMDDASRLPIPEAVRMFVWQRDGGKCIKCGNRELLEFDHIIPVSKGGSSTERNIQLLCETCNRTKGSAI